ncbi:hypothetical protein DAH66_12675 [Sphingomonas koreensis]|uniref:Uncharacterized protein n=1 Tax=Sphingomonas koreensis TaxID=93064 RepID=A0A430G2B2_9SPHN|nr:hypothetical protein [Sphingomonas koreensis]RSY83117.1 hypothetical protein DAH66_12675 [Sphingomonas koreensis]
MTIERLGVQPIVAASTAAAAKQVYRVVELGEGGETSLEVGCTNDLSVEGNANYVHWSATAETCRVERSIGGLFEPLGETADGFYVDRG